MVEKCLVCGGDIDFTFDSTDMKDMYIVSCTETSAEICGEWHCHYCGVKFCKDSSISMLSLREYTSKMNFDR